MSVTDPFIKDIKGCVQHFFKAIDNHVEITDNFFYLVLFCNTLEKIFDNGLITQQNTLYFTRHIDAYTWMVSITKENSAFITFPYVNSVDNVKARSDTKTNYGRFRLLIKYCLVKKCLHVPIELLIRTKKAHLFYRENSIIGDEILSEIFLSVLLQVSKLNFNLDLTNSSFLDCSWYIPEVVKVELVPCANLGLSVSFAGERAVIISLKSNSVVSENGKINVGDVLGKLNGSDINSSTKGRLSSILRSSKGLPINLTIAKAYNCERKEFFTPIKVLLKQLKIDIDLVLKQYEATCGEIVSKKPCSGFDVTYLGCVSVGSNGNVKQVNKAMRKLLASHFKPTYNLDDASEDLTIKIIVKLKQPVLFEIGEIGVKIKSFETSDMVLSHSYMRISSCGSVPSLPNHFAYIAGDGYCDVASNFACYIFEVKKPHVAETILQSIGQGFRRTHFAV